MSFQVIEVVRTILFVGLFMILIAILYKRLLRAMGKDPKARKYLELKEFSYDSESSRLSFLFDLPFQDQVSIRLSSSEGQVLELFSGEIEIGEQEISFDIEPLKSGKIELKISATHLESTHFLIVS